MKTKLTFMFLTLAFLLAACAPKRANFPTGTFLKSGTQDYKFVFNADGTWKQYGGILQEASGTYKVDGNVYTETSNDMDCETNVSYTYTFDGTNLTFKYVGDPQSDRCVTRSWDFNNVTYTLVK